MSRNLEGTWRVQAEDGASVRAERQERAGRAGGLVSAERGGPCHSILYGEEQFSVGNNLLKMRATRPRKTAQVFVRKESAMDVTVCSPPCSRPAVRDGFSFPL